MCRDSVVQITLGAQVMKQTAEPDHAVRALLLSQGEAKSSERRDDVEGNCDEGGDRENGVEQTGAPLTEHQQGGAQPHEKDCPPEKVHESRQPPIEREKSSCNVDFQKQ